MEMKLKLFNQEVSLPNLLLGSILVILTICLGFFIERSNFISLISLYFTFWAIYLWINLRNSFPISYWIGVAILLRGVMVFSFPNFSDDIYRFIWDGLLIVNGYNPFNYLPSTFIQDHSNIPGLTQVLFESLNSPNYYTVYPPLAQLTFASGVFIAPENQWINAVVMKLFLFGFEIGNLILLRRLLKHFQLPEKNVLWYALNPLIILEITGNLHFEGGMIFFLLLSFWLLVQHKNDWAAVAMALSIAAKLLPLLFLPFLIKRLGWWKSIRFFSIVGFVLFLTFIPLMNEVFISNFSSSLDLYFRNFEFNGSIYYVARYIGFQIKGHNLITKIGPILALIVFLSIVLKAILERNATWERLPLNMLFAITIYLFLGTTIHPWYVSLPIVLCVFHQFRYPIFWSGLIMMTYINYSYSPYFENLWIVSIEYVIVYGFLFYDLRKNRTVMK